MSVLARQNAVRLDREKTRKIFREYNETRDSKLRDQLINAHINLVEYLARRFKNRGEPLDDLIQVGCIGLIKAIDRFDPSREIEFTTYATPTVVGEMKRYFRDKGWAISVPRRLQELNLKINHVVSDLTNQLHRSPSISEIAEHLKVTSEEVVEAMETGEVYNFVSLDGSLSGDDDENAFSLLDYLGEEDRALVTTEDRTGVAEAVASLPTREQRIVYLRFFKGLTQTEIAKELDISQMHVSRLLRNTLDHLRQLIEE